MCIFCSQIFLNRSIKWGWAALERNEVKLLPSIQTQIQQCYKDVYCDVVVCTSNINLEIGASQISTPSFLETNSNSLHKFLFRIHGPLHDFFFLDSGFEVHK